MEEEAAGGPRARIIQDARVLPSERQDVPSECEGKLLFLATEAGPAEKVPDDKLITCEIGVLGVIVPTESAWLALPAKDRLQDAHTPDRYYRRARPDDDLAPGTTAIVRERPRLRKLDVGNRVQKDQLLGVINPALALDDLAIKQAKVEAADADVQASVALKEESKRRLDSILSLRANYARAVTDDDYGVARVTVERYKQEEISKRRGSAASAARAVRAQTTLNMHMIRASIDGVIKAIYKQNGEAVKNNEPVLQIQNPERLRVEAQLELQDALPLRDRVERAHDLRRKANVLRAEAQGKNQGVPGSAPRLEQEADRLTAVQIEASRVEPPLAALAGHLQAVTCIAVSSDPEPRIISGSEDGTVRIWERNPASGLWRESDRLDHRAIVTAVACTSPRSKRNLLLTATATGRGRLFDLDHLEGSERFLAGHHAGPINAAAFSSDGTLCATAGEDRCICLWDAADGALLGKTAEAHGAGITSLTCTSKGQVVSAGRDGRLLVWNLVDDGQGGQTLEKAEEFDRRSGDVPQLGVDPSGEHTVFDDGRELRVLSLTTKKIEGALRNASATAAFSTLALYSPDGKTILTNGNAAGRLQLWRAPNGTTRPAELRQYVWGGGAVTCAAFSPDSNLAVAGTQDNRVLIWQTPEQAERDQPIAGQLTYVEGFLDTSMKRVTVRASFYNPGWIIPGSSAAIVVPPLPEDKATK